ncbi:MAG: CRTAC1 family protein [Verrucomicrobia bacterium]|nr:CRTAC1 family protein [Verrucomicrobiota bacterium]
MSNESLEDDKRNNRPPASDPPEQSDPDEVAHYDEAVIGRAFRWSFVAFVALAALLAGVWFLLKRKPAPAAPKVTQITAPVTRPIMLAEIPQARFTDITAEAGIKFAHHNGAYGEKLLPETMGSGVAFFDFDNDDAPDLLFINSTDWPWKTDAARKPATLGLYRNDGKGCFEDATAGSGLDVSLYGMGVAVGDYDNDGWVDVFVTGVGGNRLFRNLGQGKFADVTVSAGVGGAPGEWSSSATWFDMENDGDLDLFVCNYVRWSKEIDLEVGYKLTGIGRAYGPPMNFQGTFPYLYRNDGTGKFTDVSPTSGVQVKNSATGVPAAKSLGVAPVDLDNNGWIDLVVANDTVQNYVFTNRTDGTFQEIGAVTGIAFDSYGNTRGAMGIDAGYFQNDGRLGIIIGNFANEMTALYVSQGASAIFTDEAITEGIGPASRLLLKFGVFFFDYDLDGRLDVFSVNGHLEEEINKVQQSQHYAQPAQLFWNSGQKNTAAFQVVPTEKAGPDLFKPIVGRGSAFADIDSDGDLDAVLTQAGGPPLLLRNDQALGHHWLRIKLVGKKANRDAIGAKVKVRVADQTLVRQVMPTRSYLSQSELPVTIGLGKANRVEAIEIVWPGNRIQKVPLELVRIDAMNVVQEP